MTDDLDNLRPEVRCALGDISYISQANHMGQQQVDTLRAELLRLAGENKELRDADTFGLDQQLVEYKRRAERAEADLAALKARIEKATVGTLGVCFNGHEPAFVGFPDRFEHDSGQDLIGHRVALVKVED